MHEIKIDKKYTFFGLEFSKCKDMAEYFGVSNVFMSAVLNGHKPPTKKMLSKVDYKKVVKKIVSYVQVYESDK